MTFVLWAFILALALAAIEVAASIATCALVGIVGWVRRMLA